MKNLKLNSALFQGIFFFGLFAICTALSMNALHIPNWLDGIVGVALAVIAQKILFYFLLDGRTKENFNWEFEGILAVLAYAAYLLFF